MNVFDLEAVLRLNDEDYKSGLDSDASKAEQVGEKIGSALRGAGKTAVAGFKAIGNASVAGAKYIMDGASATAEYGDHIDKMSQKLGISATAYQEWSAILEHSGSSIDGMQRGMMTLAQQAEKNSEAFQQLGISQEEVASMSQEDLFAAVISGLQGMEDGSERTALAQQLLGGAAKDLGPLLNTSAEDTEAMRQAVHDLGGVMSDEAVKAAAAYQDSLQDMKTAFSGLQRGLFSEFMPAITKVMDGLSAIFSGDSDGGIKMISDGVSAVVNSISESLPQFLDLGMGILMSLVQALIQNLPKLLESGGKIVGELVAGLIKAIPTLISSAPQLISGIIKGLVAAWPEIKQAGADLVTMIGQGISGLASQAWNWGADIVKNLINGIVAWAQNLWDTVSGLAQGIRNLLGFSEPKEGPLSNFHTYAPDMMQLFAKGIRDNEDMLYDTVAEAFDFGDIAANQTVNQTVESKNDQFSPTIVVQSILDGKIIGETAYKYQRDMARAFG